MVHLICIIQDSGPSSSATTASPQPRSRHPTFRVHACKEWPLQSTIIEQLKSHGLLPQFTSPLPPSNASVVPNVSKRSVRHGISHLVWTPWRNTPKTRALSTAGASVGCCNRLENHHPQVLGNHHGSLLGEATFLHTYYLLSCPSFRQTIPLEDTGLVSQR